MQYVLLCLVGFFILRVGKSQGTAAVNVQPRIRPAAVAGAFYPGSSSQLRREVSTLLTSVAEIPKIPPKAIIAPHAGYIYSGIVAASAFALLAGVGKVIHRVILAGPAHRVAARGVALPDCDAFITPLGTVPIDQQAVDALRQLPQVRFSDEAHRQEHALEVELPFLQVALDQFMIVPMVIGNIAPEAVAEALNAVWGGPETLIVISSDLSHYLPYEDAQRIDADTSRQIENFDPSIDHQQACGALPVNGLLLAARQHGLQVRRLQVLNSGDTAGDRRRVVGYGAFAFFETAPGTAAHAH